MKIATWNIERLKHKADIDKTLYSCGQIGADIFVLTETDMRVQLSYNNCFQTEKLSEINSGFY